MPAKKPKDTIFGKYVLLDRLAVGGMAEIFLAESDSLGGVTRTCVIKRILPEYSADRQFVSMFIDEARITIGLDHPNIVKLFDFGQVLGTYYMAMEFVDGLDLVDLLRAHKRMQRTVPPEVAAFVARGLCEGLEHAHSQCDYRGVPLGIVHRDVSPHNLFLSWRGDVKLGDFGIASAKNKLSVTQAGTLKGKFAYMAPEQGRGGLVDARADVWSAGVVLWEMLTRKRLFAAENPVASIGKVLHMEIPPPSHVNPDVPKVFDGILAKVLERDVDKRCGSAAEFAGSLTSYLDEVQFERQTFARFLSELDWNEETSPFTKSHVTASTPDPFAPVPSVVFQQPGAKTDSVLKDLIDRFRHTPDLWTMVEIAERHTALGNEDTAISAYRTTAALFAHRGLLVQAICAFDGARDLLSTDAYRLDIQTIAALHGTDMRRLESFLSGLGDKSFWELIKAVDKSATATRTEAIRHPPPLFGRLAPADLARLVQAARVSRLPTGSTVLREGEPGNSLFALGRGHMVVHCRPREKLVELAPLERTRPNNAAPSDSSIDRKRVYLSALADGDFFGEFSFLTGRPRSASVECMTECVVLEIDERAADDILRKDPAFTEPLLDFYKERVGELMMAKNPVFCVLAQQDRRELLERSDLNRYADQDIVVTQGDISEEMYFIKHGEVEVYRDDQGLPVFINKLSEGEFFGEMAAVHQTPRSASVRAMGDIELICMRRDDLVSILEREPMVKTMFEEAIRERASETTARLQEARLVFEGI